MNSTTNGAVSACCSRNGSGSTTRLTTKGRGRRRRVSWPMPSLGRLRRHVPAEIAEDRDVPHRAMELLEAGEGVGSPADESELREAVKEVESSVDTSSVTRLGAGTGSAYAYGYKCAPDRLKIGRSDGDVVRRIAEQVSASTPDRPVLYFVLATSNAGSWNERFTERSPWATGGWRAAARNGIGQPSLRYWQSTTQSWVKSPPGNP